MILCRKIDFILVYEEDKKDSLDNPGRISIRKDRKWRRTDKNREILPLDKKDSIG